MGENRHRHVAAARRCAMVLIAEATGWSAREIGDFFGKDPQTISHHLAKLTPEVRRQCDQIAEELLPPPQLFAIA